MNVVRLRCGGELLFDVFCEGSPVRFVVICKGGFLVDRLVVVVGEKCDFDG